MWAKHRVHRGARQNLATISCNVIEAAAALTAGTLGSEHSRRPTFPSDEQHPSTFDPNTPFTEHLFDVKDGGDRVSVRHVAR
jgi:hypothetical protein